VAMTRYAAVRALPLLMSALQCVSTGKKQPQVPPLRFAPVGMTILL
jgi:hypothetical protein